MPIFKLYQFNFIHQRLYSNIVIPQITFFGQFWQGLRRSSAEYGVAVVLDDDLYLSFSTLQTTSYLSEEAVKTVTGKFLQALIQLSSVFGRIQIESGGDGDRD